MFKIYFIYTLRRLKAKTTSSIIALIILSSSLISSYYFLDKAISSYLFDKSALNTEMKYRIEMENPITNAFQINTFPLIENFSLLTNDLQKLTHFRILNKTEIEFIGNDKKELNVFIVDTTFFNFFNLYTSINAKQLGPSELLISKRLLDELKIDFNNDTEVKIQNKSYQIGGYFTNSENHLNIDVILLRTEVLNISDQFSNLGLTYIQLNDNTNVKKIHDLLNSRKIQNTISPFGDTQSINYRLQKYSGVKYDERNQLYSSSLIYLNKSQEKYYLLIGVLLFFFGLLNLIYYFVYRDIINVNDHIIFKQYDYFVNFFVKLKFIEWTLFYSCSLIIYFICFLCFNTVLLESYSSLSISKFFSFIVISFLIGILVYLFSSFIAYSLFNKSNRVKSKYLFTFSGVYSILFYIVGSIAFIFLFQVSYLRTINLGYEVRNVIEIDLEGIGNTSIKSIKSELRKAKSVYSSSICSGEPSDNRLTLEINEQPVDLMYVDKDYFEVMNIEHSLNNFQLNSDSIKGIYASEKFYSVFNLDDTTSNRIQILGKKREILGVAKDLLVRDFKSNPYPLLYISIPEYTNTINGLKLLVKLDKLHTESINEIQNILKEINRDFIFSYRVLEDKRNTFLSDNISFEDKFINGSLFIIFLSMLGVFGLGISFVTFNQKTIVIKKIHGANDKDLTFRFMLKIIILNIIMFSISIFLANYFYLNWISDFTYQVKFYKIPFFILIVVSLSFYILGFYLKLRQLLKSQLIETLRS